LGREMMHGMGQCGHCSRRSRAGTHSEETCKQRIYHEQLAKAVPVVVLLAALSVDRAVSSAPACFCLAILASVLYSRQIHNIIILSTKLVFDCECTIILAALLQTLECPALLACGIWESLLPYTRSKNIPLSLQNILLALYQYHCTSSTTNYGVQYYCHFF